MKKRLFLTGPMGCGKSTAIAQALGSTARRGGGFFTRRQLDSSEKLTGFSLESPDGARGEIFLDFTQEKPVWNLSVFSQLGRDLLTDPDAPFLVLDEPTAALDPIAEHDIYMKYKEMTAGKSSVFISHRLASTRFCDRILFLEDGRIAEQGTHEELLARGGGYARLFQVQSRYYQEGGEADGE